MKGVNQMIFISNLREISESEYEIGFMHNMPFDPIVGLHKTEAELEEEGLLVDAILEPINVPEYTFPVLCYNPVTNSLFYKFVHRDMTYKEKITELQSQNAQMLLALVMGGLM